MGKFEKGTLYNYKYVPKGSEYEKGLMKFEEQGLCLFCPDGLKKDGREVLYELGGWRLVKNKFPYKNAKHHLLIIGETHKTTCVELTKEDYASIGQIINWANIHFGIIGGTFAMRYGEEAGVTIRHLHIHIIAPEFDRNGKVKVVKFPIG